MARRDGDSGRTLRPLRPLRPRLARHASGTQKDDGTDNVDSATSDPEDIMTQSTVAPLVDKVADTAHEDCRRSDLNMPPEELPEAPSSSDVNRGRSTIPRTPKTPRPGVAALVDRCHVAQARSDVQDECMECSTDEESVSAPDSSASLPDVMPAAASDVPLFTLNTVRNVPESSEKQSRDLRRRLRSKLIRARRRRKEAVEQVREADRSRGVSDARCREAEGQADVCSRKLVEVHQAEQERISQLLNKYHYCCTFTGTYVAVMDCGMLVCSLCFAAWVTGPQADVTRSIAIVDVEGRKRPCPLHVLYPVHFTFTPLPFEVRLFDTWLGPANGPAALCKG